MSDNNNEMPLSGVTDEMANSNTPASPTAIAGQQADHSVSSATSMAQLRLFMGMGHNKQQAEQLKQQEQKEADEKQSRERVELEQKGRDEKQQETLDNIYKFMTSPKERDMLFNKVNSRYSVNMQNPNKRQRHDELSIQRR